MSASDSCIRALRPPRAGCLAAAATLLLGHAAAAPHGLEGLGGVEAIDAVGSRLAAVARHHATTPADLAALFRRDDTLRLLDGDRLVYVDTAIPEVGHEPRVAPRALDGIPLEDALFLQTDAGADRTVYLDFDGHHSVDNGWGHDIVFPPYNVEGSSTSS